MFTESEKASKAAESATQSAAEEPKPEPRGSSEVTTTVAGLNLAHISENKHHKQSFGTKRKFYTTQSKNGSIPLDRRV